MYSINGQLNKDKSFDWNYFSNDFTNHVGPGENILTKALVKKFRQATEYVQSVGLSDCANYNQAGQETE